MKSVLKALGLSGFIAAFWWIYTMLSEPRSVAQVQEPPAQISKEAVSREAVNKETGSKETGSKDIEQATSLSTQQTKQQSTQQIQPLAVTNFSTPSEVERWRTVNDTVMGGISQSTFSVTPTGIGVFQGITSLANNGGFGSVRRASDDVDFTGIEAISIRIKGDGRDYQLRLRTDDSDRSITYRAQFETSGGEWQTIRVPIQDFEPVFRGNVIKDAPALNPENIQQVGFLIADKKSGEFRLEVDWIQLD